MLKQSKVYGLVLLGMMAANNAFSLDTDNDGIPDAIENTYVFLDTGNAADAAQDYDGDGVSNLDEHLAGTSLVDGPTVAATTTDQFLVIMNGDITVVQPMPPVVADITKSPVIIGHGQSVELKWAFSNANYVVWDRNLGQAGAMGSLVVTPSSNTSYTVTAVGDDTLRAKHTVAVIIDTDRDGLEDRLDLDDDGDGIPDTVEIANGLNPYSSEDAMLDADGDGYSNLQEFLAGKPIGTSNTSIPLVINRFFVSNERIAQAGESVTLSWQVLGATKITLRSNNGMVQTLSSENSPQWQGAITLTPMQKTYYTLEAFGPEGSMQSVLVVDLAISNSIDTWKTDIDDAFVRSSITVAQDKTFYVGSKDFNYYRYAPNQSLDWVLKGVGLVSDKALLLDNSVIIGTQGIAGIKGQIISVNAANKHVNWSFQTLSPVVASPISNVLNNKVYAVTYSGRVYAINAITGKMIWQYQLPDKNALVVSAPALNEGGNEPSLVVRATNNTLYSLNIATGSESERLIWTKPLE